MSCDNLTQKTNNKHFSASFRQSKVQDQDQDLDNQYENFNQNIDNPDIYEAEDCNQKKYHEIIHLKPLATQIKDKINEFIGHFHEAPHFTIDSRWIIRGYRINFSTPGKVLRSLFMAHNETLNIWTHLIGVALMIILILLLGLTAASTFTNSRIESVTVTKLNGYFNPLYDKIANFTELEFNWRNQIEFTKTNIKQLKNDAIKALEDNVYMIISELDQMKQGLNPETAIQLLRFLDNKVSSVSSAYESIQNSLGTFQINTLHKIAILGDNLKKHMLEFQEMLHQSVLLISLGLSLIAYEFYVHLRGVNDPHRLSRWPILIFLLSAIFCLSGSTIFHLFYCMNIKVNTVLIRIDYAGICILIFGSCFPPLYYGFYCQPIYYQTYLTVIGISSLTVFVISMMDFIHSEKWRKMKSLMYGGLGIFSGFPIMHLVPLSMQVGPENDFLPFANALPFYLGMGFSYLGGLAIYTYRCPERFKPGTFDICGHSHQLWHICVVSAIILHYIASFENYYTRIDIPCIVY